MERRKCIVLLLLAGCVGGSVTDHRSAVVSDESGAVGLGLYFINGQYSPDLDPTRVTNLEIIDGSQRYLQELYFVASAPTTVDLGLSPIETSGDFAGLDWTGVSPVDERWTQEANGFTWQQEVFYRNAAWMNLPSKFVVAQYDANGQPSGDPLPANAGLDNYWLPADDGFERRFDARIITTGCPANGDCTGGQSTAQAFVQLRAALHPDLTARQLSPTTARLDVAWTADAGHVRSVRVTHSAGLAAGYGLTVDLEETAPPARGYYLPGEAVGFQVTYRDGAGTRLFPPGALPTYQQMRDRMPEALGLRYLKFGGESLYYALKATQGDMQVGIGGPLDAMTREGTTPIEPADFFTSQIQGADVAHDSWTAVVNIIPPVAQTISCLIGNESACVAPVSDTFSFQIPAEAQPGTYVAVIKARREFEGEPQMAAASLRFQVGTTAPSSFSRLTIPGIDNNCSTCHLDRSGLPVTWHGFPGVNAAGPECMVCHTTGYFFEFASGIVERLQVIHQKSRRVNDPFWISQ